MKIAKTADSLSLLAPGTRTTGKKMPSRSLAKGGGDNNRHVTGEIVFSLFSRLLV